MSITQIRKSLESYMGEQTDADAQVWLAPTEYAKTFGDTDEVKLSLRLLVGPAESDIGEGEEKIDGLFEQVPELLRSANIPGASDLHAISCSGHRVFSAGPGSTPVLGAEWMIQVLTDD